MKGAVAAVVVAAAAALAILFGSEPAKGFKSDVVPANELVEAVEKSWPDARAADARTGRRFPQVTVVGDDGSLVYSRGRRIDGDRDAMRTGAVGFELVAGGRHVGRMWIYNGWVEKEEEARQAALRLAGGTVLAVAAFCLLVVAVSRRRLLRPFKQLSFFAREVAQGNLDVPLRMDRNNVFGPFTEAFDIMRDELGRARRAEAAAKESKKQLVAELGHDIRTPVASIAATAELLEATEASESKREKIEVIRQKAGQIEELMADVARANREEIASLRVAPVPVGSEDVERWLRAADADEAMGDFSLPHCLVSVDRLRMRQVFDNVVANSRKYAGTPIEVRASVDEHFLLIVVRDRGPGVDRGEIEAILGKGVRGSNVKGVPGEGLGLYTSSCLMERMGGALSCRLADPGFAVVLEIPLAR